LCLKLLHTKKKGMSLLELSHEFELRQPTCWEFKWKLQQAMQSSKQHPFTGEIHVDEFFISGPEVDIPRALTMPFRAPWIMGLYLSI
jgi:hypothetical protein